MLNKRLLVICPSRGRPKELMRMKESFDRTTYGRTDLSIVIDNDDEKIKEYLSLNIQFTLNNQVNNTTDIFNKVFMSNKDYEYYCLCNDDFEFKTLGWDIELCKPLKVSYANDLIGNTHNPSCPVIDGRFVRALGWLQYPRLWFMCGDLIWRDLAQDNNCLIYYKDVITEHHHWINGKAEMDSTYRRTNNEDVYSHDHREYRIWRKTVFEQNSNKIQEVIYGSS